MNSAIGYKRSGYLKEVSINNNLIYIFFKKGVQNFRGTCPTYASMQLKIFYGLDEELWFR